MKEARVRFAPSPTGDLHVGGLRTLLFNWLYARKTGGKLVLRIEDTDVARSKREFEKNIIQVTKESGLDWDEGPDVGGPHAPYRQSERMGIYLEYVKKLEKAGTLYPCFCTPDEITRKREIALKLGKTPHYDGTCSRLTKEEIEGKRASGAKAGLRFRVVPKGFKFTDLVKGEIEFAPGTVGDFFVTRAPEPSDPPSFEGVGLPVYNFCCVIDDHTMGMTEVIRGDDHLSNTARQLIIYEALGWTPPRFAHIAMVLGPDRQKLSKRTGDSTVTELYDRGILPETLLNFLVLLGWAPKSGSPMPSSGHPEIFTLNEMKAMFTVEGLSRSPAMFDPAKLHWMNSEWIRRLPLPRIMDAAAPHWEKSGLKPQVEKLERASPGFLASLTGVVRSECATLLEIPEKSRPFLEESLPAWDESALQAAKAPEFKVAVDSFVTEMGEPKDEAMWKQVLSVSAKKSGLKGKEFYLPIRLATLGSTSGVDLSHALSLLGKKRVSSRLEEARVRSGSSA